MRWSPHATSTDPGSSKPVPDKVDPRQRLPFAAVWTLGSVKYQAEANPDALTYFTTRGWMGLQEAENVVRPDGFPSKAGEVFPVLDAFAALAPHRHHRLWPARSDQPSDCDAIAFASKTGITAILINYTSRPITVLLRTGAGDDRVDLDPHGFTVREIAP